MDKGAEVSTSHADSIATNKIASTYRAAIAERFYVNERGMLADNGLSAVLLYFPSDCEPRNADRLQRRIRQAISYSTSFKDIEELNALENLAPKEPDNYLALGLYLYLEDECSRLKTKSTFLTALREHNVTLPVKQKTFDRKTLLHNALAALEDLGMLRSHGRMIWDWYKSGSYTVQNVRHCTTKNDTSMDRFGAYTFLAHDISIHQRYLGMNLAISYALGNKKNMAKRNAEAAYAYTQSLVHDRKDDIIAHTIIQGDLIREKAISDLVKPLPVPTSRATAACARDSILKMLPPPLLEILYYRGYTIAYADAETIEPCLPEDDFPGNALSHSDLSGNKGFYQNRYNTIFICNGVRDKTQTFDASNYHYAAAQTLMHETTHIAMEYLTDDEKQRLQRAIVALADEIKARSSRLPAQMKEKSCTIIPDTFAEILDHNSRLYTNYRNASWVEVVCNISGLMYTELPFSRGADSLYSQIPTLGAAAQEINDLLPLAAARCRQQLYFQHMPPETQLLRQ